jgi:ligand-binding SRPBCC domain-containing protein
MTTFRLERRQVIPADRSAVFAFFQNPWNLEAITPPWLSFTVLAASDPVVREGTRIAYRLQWQVFPMRWESRITEYREGEYFADEMVRGPYRRWYHRHAFRDVAGGVEMRDEVEYALPLGCLGVLLHRMTIRGQLAAIFEYRALAIARRFAPPTDERRL